MKWQKRRRSKMAEATEATGRKGRTLRRPKKKRTDGTRAGGEWTEAAFWGFLRSGFRDMSRRWPPIVRLALQRARRPYKGPNKRQKWEYGCAFCGGWFKGDEVKVDHIQPTGSLKSWDDVRGFLERLFCEVDGLRVLCEPCHATRTDNDRRGITTPASVEDHARPTAEKREPVAGFLFDVHDELGDDVSNQIPF